MTCERCKWFRAGAARWAVGVKGGLVDERQVGISGECRRFPPPENFRWPRVKDADWCGEFAESGKAKVESEKSEEHAPVKKRSRKRKAKAAKESGADNGELRL